MFCEFCYLFGFILPVVSGGCSGLQMDIVFLIEESNTTNIETFEKVLQLCADISGTRFTVSPTEIQIGAVTFGEDQRVLFNLLSYSHVRDVQLALRNASYGEDNLTLADGSSALDFISDNFFTSTNGDRSDVDNYIILFINSSDDDLVQTAQNVRRDPNTHIITVGLSGSDQTELSLVTGHESHAFYLDDENMLNADLVTNILSILPSCPDVCEKSYFSYGSPSTLSRHSDTDSGNLFLMTSRVFQPTCCGVISKWEFYTNRAGKVHFMVWRVNGTSYRLIGYNTITIKDSEIHSTINYTVPLYEQIAIVNGDFVGWYSIEPDMIPYDICDPDTDLSCPNQTLTGNIPDLSTASTYNWQNAGKVSSRAYAVKYYTDDNDPLVFGSGMYRVYIPNHKTQGSVVTRLDLLGIDYTEEISINLTSTTGENLFTIHENTREIKLLRNFTKDSDGQMYPVVVTAVDSCYHTASATFSLFVFNWPPVIKNLPRTITLSENQRESVLLWKLDVVDHTGEHLCCSIYDTDPYTFNFKLVFNDSAFSIYTVNNAVFSYEDINSYIVYICCEDGYDTSRSYLQVDIKEEKIKKLYTPPRWFFAALIISGVPILILFFLPLSIILTIMFDPHIMKSLEKPLQSDLTFKFTKILEKFLPRFKRRRLKNKRIPDK